MILNYHDWLNRLKKGPSQTNEAFWSETTEAPTEAPPTTRPSAPPRPSRPGPMIRPGEREQERPMARRSETKEAPTKTRPEAPPRPNRPGPMIRPGEREQERPMAALKGVMDLFFQELEKVKGTKEGETMIKKLHSKYVTKR